MTPQFLKVAYRVLSFLPYLARIELQDAESPLPNIRTLRSRSDTVIAFARAIQPIFCTQCRFHAGATIVTTAPLPPMSGANHKFNAEPIIIPPQMRQTCAVHKPTSGLGK